MSLPFRPPARRPGGERAAGGRAGGDAGSGGGAQDRWQSFLQLLRQRERVEALVPIAQPAALLAGDLAAGQQPLVGGLRFIVAAHPPRHLMSGHLARSFIEGRKKLCSGSQMSVYTALINGTTCA